jgi:hypothetical protein
MSDVTEEEIAVRSHDILVASGTARATEFEGLTTIGAATRLAVNLRGMPPVAYHLLREVAVHRLGLQPVEVKPALKLLAEAEMVNLATEGSSIKTVLPDIPYFQDLYKTIGDVGGSSEGLNEHEQLTVAIMRRLGQGPVTRDDLKTLGAESKALNRVLEIGKGAGFVLPKRARGRDVYISPGYFAEDPQAFANLTTISGASRLERILKLIKRNQGYPIKIIDERKELGGVRLDDSDIAVIKALAGEGFVPPPAVKTAHSGENHFLFGPRPGRARLAPHEVQIYNNALALASAVRQGQFLAERYAIRNPALLLQRFLERGWLGSNSEAMEQYRSVVQHGVAKLVPTGGGQAKLTLIDDPDNRRTVEMALELLQGGTDRPGPDEELILAMRRGEEYVEPLLARKSLAECKIVEADEETKHAIDTLLLRGGR